TSPSVIRGKIHCCHRIPFGARSTRNWQFSSPCLFVMSTCDAMSGGGVTSSRRAISAVCTPMPLRGPTSARPSMRTRSSYGTPQHLQRALGGGVPSKHRRALEPAGHELAAKIGIVQETFDLLVQLARARGIEIERRVAADFRKG